MKAKKISQLLIGTNNKGKLKEIKALLPKNIKIYSTSDYNLKSPQENGNTFKEKRKKPFVGIPKDKLEKYKNSIQDISYEEVEEIVKNFLNK